LGDERSRIDKKQLMKYYSSNKDAVELATIALYGLLVPWELEYLPFKTPR